MNPTELTMEELTAYLEELASMQLAEMTRDVTQKLIVMRGLDMLDCSLEELGDFVVRLMEEVADGNAQSIELFGLITDGQLEYMSIFDEVVVCQLRD